MEANFNKLYTEITNVKKSVKNLTDNMNQLGKSSGIKQQEKNAINLLKVTNALKSSVKMLGAGILGSKIFGAMKSAISTAIDATESYNLFSVAMAKDGQIWNERTGQMETFYQKAISFQDQLASKLSIYQPESMNYQAKFFSAMQSQMPNNKDTAYFLSEQLTKAGYDLASLWNTNIETAMNKLQSGVTGEARGLRDYGIDITESSLQSTATSLGIEKEVEKMSYAEKELMRYIAILQQGGQAQGDFARTMEAPANQLKMLQNNFKTLASTIGAFFIGALKNILPIVNGIVMAITEALKAIASLFSIDLNLSFGSAVEDLSGGIGDIGAGLDDAKNSAKEFNKQILKFDEINNINPPSKSSGSGAGGGVSSGVIDSGILNALKEWENGMDNINSKAQEIKDNILKWLDIDGYKKHMTNFEMILDIVKTIGAAFLTWKISSAITSFFEKLGVLSANNAFKIAAGLTLAVGGMTLMINGTQRLLDYGISPQGLVETIAGMVGSATGIGMFLNGMGVSLGKSVVIGIGVTLAVQGFQVLKDGIQDKDLGKIVGGGLETLAGGATVAIPAISGINKAIKNLPKDGKTIKFLKDYTSQLGFTKKGADMAAKSTASLGSKIAAGATRFAGGALSAIALTSSYKDLYEGSKDASKSTLEVGMSMATMGAEGAMLGTMICPGIGTALGAVAGTAAGLGAIILGTTDNTKNFNSVLTESEGTYARLNETCLNHQNRMLELTSATNAQKESLFSNVAIVDECKKQLSTLVDENGRVIGSEESVKAILDQLNESLGTNFQVTDGIITNNGETIKSYDELNSAVSKYTQEYILNSLKQIAIDEKSTAIKRMIETKDAMKEAEQQMHELTQQYNNAYEAAKKWGVSKEEKEKLDELAAKRDEAIKQFNKMSEEYGKANQDMRKSTDEMVIDTLSEYDELLGGMGEAGEGIKQILGDTSKTAEEKMKSINSYIKDGTIEAQNDISNSAKEIENTVDETGKNIEQTAANIDISDSANKTMSGYNSNLSTWKSKLPSTVSDICNSMQGTFLGMDLYSIGQNAMKGLQNGIISKARAITDSVVSISKNIIGRFNSILQIHSPSRVMMESGKYVVLGVAEGINSEANTVYEEMSKLGQGIEVSASDFGVTANVGLNEDLKQKIQTEATTNINSNFSKELENMMLNAVQNVTVDVNIEAKTEEGVIVKKAVKGINDYISQTGEMPFELVY